MKKIYYFLSTIPLVILLLIKTGVIKLTGGEPIGSGVLFFIPIFLFDVLLFIIGLVLIIVAKKRERPLKSLLISVTMLALPILYLLYHL